jgi:hypothetical protein
MAVKRWNGTSWDTYAGADTSLVRPSSITAKGDIIVGTASAAITNVAVGANYPTIIADSTTTSGVRWGDDLQILTLMGASL